MICQALTEISVQLEAIGAGILALFMDITSMF